MQIHAAAQALSLFASRRLIEVRIPGGKPGSGAKVLQELVALAGNDPAAGDHRRAGLGNADGRAGCTPSKQRGVWVVADGAPVRVPGVAARARARAGLELDDERDRRCWRSTPRATCSRRTRSSRSCCCWRPSGRTCRRSAGQRRRDSSRFDVTQLAEAVLPGDAAARAAHPGGPAAEGDEPTLVLWSCGRSCAWCGCSWCRRTGGRRLVAQPRQLPALPRASAAGPRVVRAAHRTWRALIASSRVALTATPGMNWRCWSRSCRAAAPAAHCSLIA